MDLILTRLRFSAEMRNLLIKTFDVLLKGQFVSVLIAGTGVFATMLSDRHANFPTLLNFCNYVLLTNYLIRIYIFKWHQKKPMSESHSTASTIISQYPIPSYFIAAVLDMEANYLVILAYNYTDITSIMLLDCFTIPSAMILSYLFLRYEYSSHHILGAVICIIGLGIIVLTDVLFQSNNSEASSPIIGDILCLCGSFMYATSNVYQEHIVKHHSREEYLGYVGFFGMFIAFIQCIFTDSKAILKTVFTLDIISYMTGFVLCMFLMYASTSRFLIEYDATLFNMSLLTSDVYAVIFSYLMTGQIVHWPYFIAFFLVMIGLFVYHKESSPFQTIQFQSSDQMRTHSDDRSMTSSGTYSLVGNASIHDEILAPKDNYNPINHREDSNYKGKTVNNKVYVNGV